MIVALSIASALLLSAPSPAPSREAPAGKVGMTTRRLVPPGDYEWRGAKKQALQVTVWYPAGPGAVEAAIRMPSTKPLWEIGSAAAEAPIAPSNRPFPLVVLSHGTGGGALQMGWLGIALARAGFVAAAVDHPGNSYADEYTTEGFLLRWERARDLRAVIDGLLADETFGKRVDKGRIGAAGFSLGGYTVVELAGGRTDLDAFVLFCKDHPSACPPPPELPDLNERIPTAIRENPRVWPSMKRAGDSYRDERVRAVFAIAPAVGPSFTPSGLASIAIPVRIVVGDGDRSAPADVNAAYYAKHIPGARLDVLPGGVAHYTFLSLPTAQCRKDLPLLASDAPGVDRAAVHAQVAGMAAEFFGQALK
jgi:predicted dienelactone hydrolase